MDMPTSAWNPDLFPNLTAGTNCDLTSAQTKRYNCIAWAAGENFRNWWPDAMGVGFWPHGVSRKVTLDAFIKAYSTRGYKLCFAGALEPGVEKIALFTKQGQSGDPEPTHAALQLADGKWTSKLGHLEDICHHTVEGVECSTYGRVACFLSRPRPRL